MSSRKTFGSKPCSIARTLDVVGDWWTLLVLRDVLLGVRRFDELRGSLGVATNVLTLRLRRLTDAGILDRHAYQEHPPRFEYGLTEKGRDLFPVLITLMQWGDRHLRGSEGPPRALIHATCGRATQPELVCAHCRSEVSSRNTRSVTPRELSGALKALRPRRPRRQPA